MQGHPRLPYLGSEHKRMIYDLTEVRIAAEPLGLHDEHQFEQFRESEQSNARKKLDMCCRAEQVHD